METLFHTILVATDGSESGDRAVSLAASLAREHKAELVVCSAVDSVAAMASCASPYGEMDGGQLIGSLQEAAEGVLEQAGEIAKRADVSATKVVISGRAAEAILGCASERRADAIVVGTQGRRGFERLFLGSTAAELLRRSTIPTFVVPPFAEPTTAIGRILVAVDDSEPSDAALDFAMRFAEVERASLVLCSVVETHNLFDKAASYGYDPRPLFTDLRQAASDHLQKGAALADARALTNEIAIVDGEPASEIVATAKLHGAQAIVIGTHGRRGLRRMFLGSVAESVVREATVPVVVIRTDVAAPRSSDRTAAAVASS